MNGELFVRSKLNPILTPDNWPYPVTAVLNPAAIKHNGKTVLLVRTVDRKERSHLSIARSVDGLTNWAISPSPILKADPSFFEGVKGLEDPRIVWVEELKQFIIACVSFRTDYPETPYGISLFRTSDFSAFFRMGKPLEPGNKNPSLFPEKIDGLYALIHRPIIEGAPYIAVSFSPNLRFWGEGKPILSTKQWSWDGDKVGLGCPPIKTKGGWLLIYHGSAGKANKLVYRVGLALLGLKTLELIRRSEEWVFGPEKDYEGGPDGIVFPCGYVLDKETGELRIYYGTNDSKIGVAISNISKVLDYLA